ESGGMQLVIHAPFGSRINKAWGLALRKCFCRSFNFELQAAATDDGLNISLAEQHSFPLSDVFNFLSPASLAHILEQAALQSPIFATRFRWDANRSLALLRFQGGKKVPPFIQRMRSDDLLAAVFPDAAACQDNIEGDIQLPEHPLIEEVMKDVLTEAMDLPGLQKILDEISSGEISCCSVDTPLPSAFSHEILNANPYAFLDDAPLEERRSRAVELRRVLPDKFKDLALLDAGALSQVQLEILPDVRDPDELHDLLQTLVLAPEERFKKLVPGKELFFQELQKQKRVARLELDGKVYFLAAEKKYCFEAMYKNAGAKVQYLNELADIKGPEISSEDALYLCLQGWFSYFTAVTAEELSSVFSIALSEIEFALLKMEASGAILRGHFTDSEHLEWSERRILSRIHKLTIGSLRKEIEAVSPAQFMNWLLQWQHLAAASQLANDERSTLEILRQLQGLDLPANAWESQILCRRIKDYRPEVLDRLCLTGRLAWGRLSPHPGSLESSQKDKNWRVVPSSVSPIAFFLRQECDWMSAKHPAAAFENNQGLSHEAIAVREFLKQRGASFFAEITRATGRLQSEVENALWELVSAGLVTADGFDNLRSLIDPKRRSGQGRARNQRPRHSTGRWSLLYVDELERSKQLEAFCFVLLKRYGVVFRDLLARENNAPRWRDLLLSFRRLEDRGEIRGGRFVSGFIGEQFALPEAVESLRASRHRSSSEIISISAADPLNLIGIIIPGKKVASSAAATVSFQNGSQYIDPSEAANRPA
ncbi:MAG: hypothetical protein K2X27_00930, partial [Candidatus Obscuribacterales bacterium]|nr:hypothetical protein [Candidatus Obscuribacterales bacterium]